jgi:hypothetical protein
VDLKQKEKDVNNKLQLYGIFEGMPPGAIGAYTPLRVAHIPM